MNEPMATWPWSRCRARASAAGVLARCDLKSRHEGDHKAERGMYWIAWSSSIWILGGP